VERDPDERPAGGTGDADPRDADPFGAADPFDDIVSGWRSEGTVPEWPSAPPVGSNKLWFADPSPSTDEPVRDTDLTRDMELRGTGDDTGELFVDDATTPPPTPAPVAPAPPPIHRPGPAAEEDDHFVPPEPPPIPRIGPPAAVGLVLLVLGLVLVSAPQWIGVPPVYGLPLGLLSLASGLGWLVLRLWPTQDDTSDPDDDEDGAVI
jgi:hypothetical protein